MNNLLNCLNKKYLLFAVIISIIFVFVASHSTSPLYPNYYGHDSAQFQLLGKCWIQGIIPPLDIFDHKGPFIFFINAIGYYISNSSNGVFFIQIIFLTCTIYILTITASYYLSSSIVTYFAVLVTLIFLCSSYNEGNLTEEYCLPFISLCAYLQLKFLYNKIDVHKPFYSLIYGLSFGVCLCTRITNAVMICSGLFVIYIVLLCYKSYKNCIVNIFCFAFGVFIFCFPFGFYYYIHNGLYDAFYCAVLANIEYKNHITSWIFNAQLFNYFTYIDFFFPTYCMFFSSIFLFLRKKYALASFCVLTSTLESYLFLSGSLFRHYAVIATPQFLLFFCELILYVKTKIEFCRILNSLQKICLITVSVFSIYNVIDFIGNSFRIHNLYSNNIYEYDDILKLANTKENFIAYGGDSLVHFYIRNDIIPCYKYYILQEWQIKTMPKITYEIRLLYSSCKAKWILSDNNIKNIQDIIYEKYKLIGSTKNYKLWKLK